VEPRQVVQAVGLAIVLSLPVGIILAWASTLWPQVPTLPGVQYASDTENLSFWQTPLSSLLPMRPFTVPSDQPKLLVIDPVWYIIEIAGVFLLAVPYIPGFKERVE